MSEPNGRQRLRWSETMRRIRVDRERLERLLAAQAAGDETSAGLHPAFLCVLLYRISNHFHRGGHRYLARMFWHFNSLLTGADISPPANLGEGLVVLSPPGTAISAHAGRNLTVMALAGLGSELGRREDIGAGPGLPVVGDDVVLEPHTGVLGPIRLGDRVRVCAGTVVYNDVPDDTLARGPQARFLRRREVS